MAAFACCSPLGSGVGGIRYSTAPRTYRDTRVRRRRYAVACASVDELSAPLARRLEALYTQAISKNGGTERILVGLVGIPGSGKSSLARSTVMRLGLSKCDVISMDGFHVPRAELDEQGLLRRGAPFTYDDAAFEECLRSAKRGDVLRVPVFDHRIKDPQPGRELSAGVRVVIVEGNYLLHWPQISQILHETWFLDVDLKKAMSRVLKRLIKEIGFGLEEATSRVKNNDAVNAVDILNSRKHANFTLDCQTATVTELNPVPNSNNIARADAPFVSETTTTSTPGNR